MYLKTWEEFTKAAEQLYLSSPTRVSENCAGNAVHAANTRSRFLRLLVSVRDQVQTHGRQIGIEDDRRRGCKFSYHLAFLVFTQRWSMSYNSEANKILFTVFGVPDGSAAGREEIGKVQ